VPFFNVWFGDVSHLLDYIWSLPSDSVPPLVSSLLLHLVAVGGINYIADEKTTWLNAD
jgi:hypothetical protein